MTNKQFTVNLAGVQVGDTVAIMEREGADLVYNFVRCAAISKRTPKRVTVEDIEYKLDGFPVRSGRTRIRFATSDEYHPAKRRKGTAPRKETLILQPQFELERESEMTVILHAGMDDFFITTVGPINGNDFIKLQRMVKVLNEHFHA